MTDDLRTRIAAVLNANLPVMEYLRPGDTEYAADAVIRELTEIIPPIVATAIQGYVQAELVAISHHGEAGEYEALKRLNREALQIAKYATTHKDWNG